MLSDLKRLGEQLGVADRICWLGNVAEPKALLQASDIFLLASVGEAFGLVLAEAMACGVPIVGSRSGSLTEVVEEERTGLLAPPHDAAGFADSIEHLAQDRRLRQEMGIGRSSASDGTSPSIATSRKRSTCTRCSEDESNREPPRSQLAR
jgi:glycosyltransferase involved in cell wall biosynthesis